MVATAESARTKSEPTAGRIAASWVATVLALAVHNGERWMSGLTGWIAEHPWMPGRALHGDHAQFGLALVIVTVCGADDRRHCRGIAGAVERGGAGVRGLRLDHQRRQSPRHQRALLEPDAWSSQRQYPVASSRSGYRTNDATLHSDGAHGGDDSALGCGARGGFAPRRSRPRAHDLDHLVSADQQYAVMGGHLRHLPGGEVHDQSDYEGLAGKMKTSRHRDALVTEQLRVDSGARITWNHPTRKVLPCPVVSTLSWPRSRPFRSSSSPTAPARRRRRRGRS